MTIVQKYGINFNLNIDIKKILLENSGNSRAERMTNQVQSTEVVRESIEQVSGFTTENDDVVNPMEFFSE